MNRILVGETLLAAVSLSAPAVAQADPLTDLLNAGSSLLDAGSSAFTNPGVPGNPPPPGNPGNPSSNGVVSIAVAVNSYHGRDLGPNIFGAGFSPGVKWSARDQANAEISGGKCQIEVSFPGTDKPTHKTASCSGGIGVTSQSHYRTPGQYTIVVTDRVSGAVGSSTFTVAN